MKRIISKPHLFFFGMIPFCLIVCFLYGKESINIAYYNVPISFDYVTIFSISSVFFGMIGLNYFSLILLKKEIKKGLTLLHLILQITSFVLFILYLFSMNNLESGQEKELLSFTFFISFFLFLVSILIHLINFFVSIFLQVE